MQLGYSRYVAQGGDWGAFVVDQMGLQALAGLLAIHTNLPATVPADIDKVTLAGEPPPYGSRPRSSAAYDGLISFEMSDWTKKKFDDLRDVSPQDAQMQ